VPLVRFTTNLVRHGGPLPDVRVDGATVRAALEAAFARYPQARGYVLDDQGWLRKHMSVFVDDEQIVDRRGLTDPVGSDSTVDLFQALSGG
jgi:sulfur-carrier protein